MSACEACLLACNACIEVTRATGLSAAQFVMDATVCVQACELALHAMAGDGAIARSACSAAARSCEGLARDCMLLPYQEYRRCAQACYRAAMECHRVAQGGGMAAQALPARAVCLQP